MKVPAQIERESHRLIITRRNASEILFASNGFDWSLPGVGILPRHRIAEQLTEKLQVERGLRAHCLFYLAHSGSDRNTIPSKYAVMEAHQSDGKAPAGTRWFPIAGNGSHFVVPAEDNAAITEAILEMNTYLNNATMGPFARLGWMEELLEWVQTRIDPMNLRVTGAIRQLNASPTFSLIRLETTGTAVWFKATGEPNLHELPVSLSLARFFPGYVPEILGVHPKWNAWISKEAAGTPLDDHEQSSCWERVARTLAELQVDSIVTCPQLLGDHCKDLRLTRIVELVDPFLARMADLMAAQVKLSPEPLTKSNLAFLGDRLKDACAALQELGVPDTLGHIDFNPGNIIVSATRCCFLDWAEGCVTHPFVTFEYLQEHYRRRLGSGAPVQKITSAYLEPWQSVFSSDRLRYVLVFSPLIAVFVSAVADTTWRSIDSSQDARGAGYFRSLTRRMFREATSVAQWSHQCLS
jgi:hypothetical protein